MNFLRKGNEKLTYLKCWDILIVTLIMFGYFIYSSTTSFLGLPEINITQIPEFTNDANWQALVLQFGLLVITFVYLYLRNFDFSNWKIKVSLKSILMGIAMFIGVALLFDIYYTVVYSLFPIDNSMPYEAQQASESLSTFQNIDLSLILYSMLNGFYEEIFFLGVCLSVKPEKRNYYFIYSLIIRYSFHTYQGNVSALAIGFLVGGIYYFLYTRAKEKNLFPFFLAHAITDVFGAGIISYFF
ncbi:CPBP family glutamic-type intramembrane protease [Streptococcus ruminantium]|uniref:CPBP family glutamic-type intramembrane protease n=1 Tax=Streptococcus ruminantium TaxID=1917441 RepID=A0ABU1B2T8_9STRE|nr:CPBP family glutamic-type intramembrane protease [Streptococcus ruminantium]MDQ8758992.1 CPBP family glutamic-type intramembrane protease [Streptococcus ruminantium]MDQ8765016.1 CPBP family glutamic-type intramembrane protease [Streptococcus ruminantium]MDQ8767347.1 CPBP family glutamic-type intramembrane protease [Streptococcus ruminantium]MDQ8769118.1 CPBP family glutamic-type intramembrane protease [Streptococcus ruminantium]MDQ8775374.1 CPBP family glutamic-type intramembrane protease [